MTPSCLTEHPAKLLPVGSTGGGASPPPSLRRRFRNSQPGHHRGLQAATGAAAAEKPPLSETHTSKVEPDARRSEICEAADPDGCAQRKSRRSDEICTGGAQRCERDVLASIGSRSSRLRKQVQQNPAARRVTRAFLPVNSRLAPAGRAFLPLSGGVTHGASPSRPGVNARKTRRSHLPNAGLHLSAGVA